MNRLLIAVALICGAALTASGQTAQQMKAQQSLQGAEIEYSSAKELAGSLHEQFPDIVFSADSSSNYLYFRSSDEDAAPIMSLIEKIERLAYEREVELKVAAEEKKQQQAALYQDVQAELKMSVFELAHIAGDDARETLLQLGLFDHGTSVTVKPGGNGLIVRGPQSNLKVIEALLQRIDTPGAKVPGGKGQSTVSRLVFSSASWRRESRCGAQWIWRRRLCPSHATRQRATGFYPRKGDC